MGILYFSTIYCLIKFVVSSHASLSPENVIDCKGAYGPWTPCEPFEGHDTHHDTEDDFNFERGKDGYYVGECFQYRVYHIIVHPKNGGNKCSRNDGSKFFQSCADCSSIPAVGKRLNNPATDPTMRFLAIAAGVLCTVMTIACIWILAQRLCKQRARTDIAFLPAVSNSGTTIPTYSTRASQPKSCNSQEIPDTIGKGFCLKSEAIADLEDS